MSKTTFYISVVVIMIIAIIIFLKFPTTTTPQNYVDMSISTTVKNNLSYILNKGI